MKVAAVARQIGNSISYKIILENLKNEVQNLQHHKQRVQENLPWYSKEFQTQIGWLKSVDEFVEKVNAFLNYYEGKDTCTNFLWWYKVRKQAKKMKLEISLLHEKGLSIDPSKYYKAPEDIINDIMLALKDPLIQTVGVWGLVGAGTTTLAEKVEEKAKEENLFNEVVIMNVTAKPNVKQVQKSTAAKLGMEFVENDEDEEKMHLKRRNRLRWRIKKVKTILVIVDDICGDPQEFDLEAFGIPLADEHKGCKLLLTSKNLDFIQTLRGDPKARVFKLELLLEDEARSLFKKVVGDVAQVSEASSLVTEIVKSCACVAIAIFAIAKVLRNKDLLALKYALEQLKKNFSPIKLFYDCLENEELKSLFLLLTIRGRGAINKYNIYTDMWAGLFRNLDSYEATRNKCDLLISDLKAYGILVEDKGESVSINDLIWETAYSIAQSDLKALVIYREWPSEECLRSLRFCNMTIASDVQIPKRLQCPELQEIILSTNSPSMQVSDSFFEDTKLLKVLDFVGFDCSKLSTSFALLKNLQTLSMHKCKLGDISNVGELLNLKMLSLLGSSIQQLPRQVRQLQKLLILDLRDTNLQVIPPNVLSSLISLEELYLRNSFCNWEVERSNNENSNASLKELTNLHHLTYIEDLYVPYLQAWPVDLCFEKLKSYTIFIGDSWGQTHDGDHGMKTLKLKLDRSFQLEDGIKKMVKSVDVLYLDELNGVQNVHRDLDGDDFPHLRSLFVQNNYEIKCISRSSSSLYSFSNLESFYLNNVSNIEHISHGPLSEKSFFKIKVIKLQKCDAMTCLFSNSMIKCLPLLADLEVSKCKLIQAIMHVEDVENPYIEFPKLWSLTLQEVPALISFCLSSCIDTPHLFKDKVCFPNLEILVISQASKVTNIWNPDEDSSSTSFLKLKNVHIADCEKLQTIFPPLISNILHNLKTLEVINCTSVTTIFAISEQISLPLTFIKLAQLPELERACHYGPLAKFIELKRMNLEVLPSLKSFLDSTHFELLSLEEVLVNRCPELQTFGLGKIKQSQLKSVIVDNEEQVNNKIKVAQLFEVLDDEFATITSYTIDGEMELQKALDLIQYKSSFANLKWLRVKNCTTDLQDPLYYFLWHSELEYLTIEQCRTIALIYDHRCTGSLKELTLLEVDDLKSLWDSNPFYDIPILDLPQLNEIKIKLCGKLRFIVNDSELSKVAMISLKKVELVSLSEFSMFNGPRRCAFGFPVLKILVIKECPQLETFTPGIATEDELSTTDGKSFSELSEFMLDSCDRLVCVISSKTLLQEFGNLKKLTVSHCHELKTVFNVLQGEIISHSSELLQQLSELALAYLPNLIHIINYKLETGAKIVFPQLKLVSLQNLTNLPTFLPSTFEFPSLETLMIENCPALKTFVEESHELKDHLTPPVSNYFFPSSLSLDKLKVLHVINQEVENLWHYSCPSESICELEHLTLSNNKKLLSVISSSMITRFSNLKKLIVDNCELLTEVFYLEDDKQGHDIKEMLPQLRELGLGNLSGLTSPWNKEPQVPFFPNLVFLHIVHCGSLKSLFSLSVAKNLGKLKLLKLYNCEKVEEVMSGDKDENVSVIFPEVECLVLKDLPKLVCFCQQNGTFDWPKLQTVRVSNIPSMKTFSRGHVNTPLLTSIYVTFVEKYWDGNLNKTISSMHNNAGM